MAKGRLFPGWYYLPRESESRIKPLPEQASSQSTFGPSPLLPFYSAFYDFYSAFYEESKRPMSATAQKLLQAARDAAPDESAAFGGMLSELEEGFRADTLLMLADLLESWRLPQWAVTLRHCAKVPCFPCKVSAPVFGYSWAWFHTANSPTSVPMLHTLPTALFDALSVPVSEWGVGTASPAPGKWYTRLVVALSDLHDVFARTQVPPPGG